MTKRARSITCFAAVLTLSLLATVPAVAQTVEVAANWNAPTDGSPVDRYILQISTDGGPFATVGTTDATDYTFNLDMGHVYVARVAGIDEVERQGPWSSDSAPYVPGIAAPGQPGRPFIL